MSNPTPIRQFDTARRFEYSLAVGNQAVDLTAATCSLFIRDGQTIYTRTPVITGSAANGQVYYDLVYDDTKNAGLHHLEFSVTFNDGTVLRIPTTSSIQLDVYPSIATNVQPWPGRV